MEQYSKFFSIIKTIANKLYEWISSGNIIYLISGYDADGISASSIIIKLIHRLEGKFHLRFINNIDLNWIKSFIGEFKNKIESSYFIFLDLGITTLHYLNKHFPHGQVIVIDHDFPRNKIRHYDILYTNLVELGINGNFEISSSGIAYFIIKEINKLNIELGSSNFIENLPILGIIGALGDNQDVGNKHTLIGLNNLIINDCKQMDLIIEEENLRFFRHDGPILVSLLETLDPYLIDLTNDKRKINELLLKLNIPSNIPLNELNTQQKSILNENLLQFIHDAKDLVGINYFYKKETHIDILKNLREFSLLLNACGRLNFPGIGLSICLGDRGVQLKEAKELYKKYRDAISICLDWVRTPPNIIETENIQCIIAENFIGEKLIIPVIMISLKCHFLNPEKIPLGYLNYNENSKVIYTVVHSQEYIEKGIDIWEALKQTNKKLKIETKTIGNKIKSRVIIPKTIQIQQYLNILNENIQKQII
ncbi:MAG: hypothetical protein ACTSPY_03595 [Candidatus Helarchaeota archaeon]